MIIRIALTSLLLLSISGCAAFRATPLPLRDPNVDVVWPKPPEQARIRFLREIAGPEDVQEKKGRFQNLVEMVTGDSGGNIDLYNPYGVATDGGSLIFIADPSSGVVHRYDLTTREATYIYLAGDELIGSPVGVMADADGGVYITDAVKAKVYKFKKDGEFVRTLPPPPSNFQRPAGIAVNSRGDKYIVDVLAHKLYVYDKDDRYLRDFPNAKSGEALNLPTNVAVDRLDNVYVSDSMNFKVRVYDREGNLKASIGQIGDAPGSFARPKGIAVDSDLHIYIIDAVFDNFQIFDQKGNLLLVVGRRGEGPGEFYLPSGIFIDKNDRIYLTDTYNRRIQIFQYLKEGVK